MLKIRPIETKEAQKTASEACKVTYYPNCMAYGAYIDDEFIGISQFTLDDNFGYIKNIAPADGVDDFEAMFIMGRATMNFIDLCHVHKCYIESSETLERLILALGFKRQDGGKFLADMTNMFTNPCKNESK